MCNVVIVNLGSYGMFVMEDSPIKRTAVYLGCSITLKPALGGSHSRNLFPEHLMPPGVAFHPMECQNPPFPVAHQHDDRNAASRVGPCHATRALTSSANLTGRQTVHCIQTGPTTDAMRIPIHNLFPDKEVEDVDAIDGRLDPPLPNSSLCPAGRGSR